MAPRRAQLVTQILIFLLATLLGVASGYLTNSGNSVSALRLLQRASLPLAGLATLLIISLMIFQHRQEIRAVRPLWDSERSPFPGLESFTESDGGIFFGRDDEVAELAGLLNPISPDKARRFIVMAGPSGVGKTSLVHAGLLPLLARQRRRWLVVPSITPGEAPVGNLARSLASMFRDMKWQDVHALLSDDSSGLARCADLLRKECRMGSSPVLAVVDQAEELITTSSADEQDRFLQLMSDSLQADSRLWVIMAMRSEFLTTFLSGDYSRLFLNPMTVGKLSQEHLIETIEGPAARAGVRFDPPSLVPSMAQDAGTGLGLPLLAYTLQELYLRAGPAKTISGAAYRAAGGVAGAMVRQADRAAAELREAGLGERVFPTLSRFVTLTEGSPTRRRVPRSQLGEPESVIAEAFVRARLIVSDVHGADAMLEIAHEALFEHWAPLRQEIEAHAEELRARADLDRWSLDWTRSGRQEAYLLQGERLRRATRWEFEPGSVPGSRHLVAEFLDASRRADRATMERLSDSIARTALAAMDADPAHGLLLALTAVQECAATVLARRALITGLCMSWVRAVFPGHKDFMWRIAWSPDGNRLASCSSDGTALIWDICTASEICQLKGHEGEVYGLAWAPDGAQLATASADRTARLWDARDGSELLVLSGHERTVRDIAWSGDGAHLATASDDRTVRIWNASDGTGQLAIHGHVGPVGGIAWSPDDTRIASSSADQTCRIWDPQNGIGLLTLRGHSGIVTSVRWSPDARQIATVSNDRTVRIWSASDGAELAVLHGHTGWVRDVAWSADGQYLASAADDATARIWDTTSGSPVMILRNGRSGVRGVAWSPRGRRLAMSATDGIARAADVGADIEALVIRGDASTFWDVAWSPDGRRIATAQTASLSVWDAENGTRLLRLTPEIGQLRSVDWSPDGRYLAIASGDGIAEIWDAATGTPHQTLAGHDDSIRSIAWSPEGNRLATASADHTARIWDARNGRQVLPAEEHSASVRGISWHPGGGCVATACTDGTGRVWDASTGLPLLVLAGHEKPLMDIHWSPDGLRIATASLDCSVRLWDARDGSALAVLLGHEETIPAVRWSPTSKLLATASYDRTIRIWDGAGAGEIAVVGVHAVRAECLSWSPGGQQIIAGAQDNTARIWKTSVETEALISQARQRVFRTLTSSERHALMLPGS